RVGDEAATVALHDAVRHALAAAGKSPQQIVATCLGISGASDANVILWANDVLTSVLSGNVEIIGDHMIALEAAFPHSTGVMAIAGTGSIVIGRNHKGETPRSGGPG